MGKDILTNARIFPDLDTLSRAAVEDSVRVANDAVGARGKCLIALSGGRTPEKAYELWSTEFREKMPWAKTHFFWGDERFVPANDPKNNYRMTRESLFRHIPTPPENIHPIETNFAQADEAARAYEKVLREFISETGPSFDLMFLGVGGEGHTASLFPDSPALREEKRWVVGVKAPAEPPVRVSLTFPILRRARVTYFLVAGPEKQEIVATLRRDASGGIEKLPVEMVRPEGEMIWFLDRAAAGETGAALHG
ncbi:MAG TPA: 6-phosphogluconolactonase [Candidatus Acidoferrales bacterium]|nr:6-phosphogluconolactonase [Candidatus Acidoferrales bacterium]